MLGENSPTNLTVRSKVRSTKRQIWNGVCNAFDGFFSKGQTYKLADNPATVTGIGSMVYCSIWLSEIFDEAPWSFSVRSFLDWDTACNGTLRHRVGTKCRTPLRAIFKMPALYVVGVPVHVLSCRYNIQSCPSSSLPSSLGHAAYQHALFNSNTVLSCPFASIHCPSSHPLPC